MFRMAPAVIAAAFAFPTPADARNALECYPLRQLEQALTARYGEMQQFRARERDGVEYRLYVNGQTGTWSWVGIPSGANIACMMFSGSGTQGPASSDKPAAGGDDVLF